MQGLETGPAVRRLIAAATGKNKKCRKYLDIRAKTAGVARRASAKTEGGGDGRC
jgi:hypothetical protein